jgi:PKD repeat protein
MRYVNLFSVTRRGHKRLTKTGAYAMTLVPAAALLLLMHIALTSPARRAFAQTGNAGIITQTTTADFGAVCAVLTDTSVANISGGEIRLRPTLEDYFDGTEVNTNTWVISDSNPGAGGSPSITVTNGVAVLDGYYLRSQLNLQGTQPRFFEAGVRVISATVPNTTLVPANVDLGFYRERGPLYAPPLANSALRMFVFRDSLNPTWGYVLGRDAATTGFLTNITDVNSLNDLTLTNTFRIEWGTTDTNYFVNGAGVSRDSGDTLPHVGVANLDTWVFLYAQDPSGPDRTPLQVDWVRAGNYPVSGTFTSCAQDSGRISNWGTLVASTTTPAGTGIVFSTRTSNDGAAWTSWANLSGNAITSPSGRYLQYRAEFTTSDVLQSPEVQQVVLTYFGPNSLNIVPPSAALNPGASQQFNAQVFDQNNNPIVGSAITWALINGGGTINSSGLFTAGLPSGTFAGTVQATAGGLTQTATVTVNALNPIADAGGPYNGVEGQVVALSGTGSSDPNGGSLSFAWDLDNDGSFDDSTSPTPLYQWNDQGNYTVALSVTKSNGQFATDTATVTITNTNPVINSITNTSPELKGNPITFTVLASDVVFDPLLYSFDWTSDGTYDIVDQVSNIASHAYPASGNFTATIRVRDGDGGQAIGTSPVRVSDALVTINSVTNTGPVNLGSSVTVTVSATVTPTQALLYSFDWTSDGTYDIVDQASASAAHTYSASGTYTVTVRASTSSGDLATGTTQVDVNPQVKVYAPLLFKQ